MTIDPTTMPILANIMAKYANCYELLGSSAHSNEIQTNLGLVLIYIPHFMPLYICNGLSDLSQSWGMRFCEPASDCEPLWAMRAIDEIASHSWNCEPGQKNENYDLARREISGTALWYYEQIQLFLTIFFHFPHVSGSFSTLARGSFSLRSGQLWSGTTL